jgi:type IV secretion system protein VirB5
MRIQARELFKQAKGPVQSRFSSLIGQDDDYVNKLMKDNRTWQLIGLCAVLMLVFTVIGWFYIASRKTETVMVIEVNELGRARYAGKVTGGTFLDGYGIKDYMIESVIADFVEYTRSIYADGDVMNNNYRRAANHLSNELKEKLRNELIEEDPFAQIGRTKRIVVIESAIRMTKATWQFDWYDIVTDLSGRELRRIRMRGMFTVAAQEPQNEAERTANPLGIFIVDYNIIQVNEVLR